MITEKALKRARILAFREKHGLEATMEAFQLKRRSLFNWKKKLREAGGKFEGLNDKSKAPQRRRKRLWRLELIAEIRRLREKYPNLGKEKIHPVLKVFCETNRLLCPKPKTIGCQKICYRL